MNKTNNFMFIHMPKTGGSFVTSVLREFYLPSNRPIHRPWKAVNRLKWFLNREADYLEFNKHGTCSDIPEKYAHLPVLSCFRNPFDWYVSNYKFQWWKTNPEDYPELEADPQWPNIDFPYYLYLSHHKWLHQRNPNVNVNPTFGRLTTLFINYYCRNPNQLLSMQGAHDAMFEVIDHALYPITFLDTNDLNTELYSFLLKQKHLSKRLAFIKEKSPISPRNLRKPHETWESFYTKVLAEEVFKRDKVLFDFFPHYRAVATDFLARL